MPPAPERGRVRDLGEYLNNPKGGNLDLEEALKIADEAPVEGRFVKRQRVEAPHRPPAEFNRQPVPDGGFVEDGARVYRGDKDFVAQHRRDHIEARGIPPKHNNQLLPSNDAFIHVNGDPAGRGTNFASTSKVLQIAKDFGERLGVDGRKSHAVAICEAVNGVDVNVTADLLNVARNAIYPHECEVSMFGGIAPQNVQGFLVWREGVPQPVWHPNPNFIPCPPAQVNVPVPVPVHVDVPVPPTLLPASLAAGVAIAVARVATMANDESNSEDSSSCTV